MFTSSRHSFDWRTIVLVCTTACATHSNRERTTTARALEPPLSAQEILMLSDALVDLTRQQTSSATICVSLLGPSPGRIVPPEELLQALARARTVVPDARCPYTYQKMFATVDAAGKSTEPPRPPGYVDPYHVQLGRPQFDGVDHAYIYVRELQGTRGRDFVCAAGGIAGRNVTCKVASSWVH